VTTQTTLAVHRCEALTRRLGERTGIAWTFGYIGNVDPHRDDRRWYAFAAHPGRVGTSRDSIGGVPTEDLDELVSMLQGAVQLLTVLAEPR